MTADRILDPDVFSQLFDDLVGLLPSQRQFGVSVGLEDIFPVRDLEPVKIVGHGLIDLAVEFIALDLLGLEFLDSNASPGDVFRCQLKQRFNAASGIDTKDQDDVIAIPAHIVVASRIRLVSSDQTEPAHLVEVIQLERVDIDSTLSVTVIYSRHFSPSFKTRANSARLSDFLQDGCIYSICVFSPEIALFALLEC